MDIRSDGEKVRPSESDMIIHSRDACDRIDEADLCFDGRRAAFAEDLLVEVWLAKGVVQRVCRELVVAE